ncbi:MAG: hypothetical protein IJ111_08595 [Eggerthellaceae bacterium]|nr:hypothetical protein [Eggerthellaceae bacterium]
MALLVTLFAGAFFLLGALVAWRAHGHGAIEDYSVAIAFGSLACVAITDLAPEAIEVAEEHGWLLVASLIIAGAVVLIALDRMIPDHHAEDGEEGAAHIGAMAVLAVSVHNIAEGAAIFAIASQDLSAGLALALGVGLHNAPMGMLFYSTMESGRARGVAVLAAAVLSTFVGGLIMFLLGDVIDGAVMDGVVCVALGMIVYILFAELLPAMVRRGQPVRSIVGVVIGAAFVLVGSLFE